MNSQRPNRRLRYVALAASCLTVIGCTNFGGNPFASNGPRDGGGARYAPMVERFSALHAENPGSRDALLGLARALRYGGQVDKAVALLENAGATHAQSADYQTELAAARLAAGDQAGAKRALNTSLAQDPDFWRAHATLGVLYAVEDRHSLAMDAYTVALEQCPDSPSIHNNMGLSAANLGDVDGAVAWLGLARSLQPDSRQITANYELFTEIARSCPNCDEADVRQLVASLQPTDWSGSGGDLACGPSAADIANALAEREFVDVRVEFEFDSDRLLPSAKATLNEVGAVLMSSDFVAQDFLIEGHTDAVGTDAYNQDLSERRAASVVRYLTKTGGVPGPRLESVGYGEQRLRDRDNPTSGENRRVRIAIIRKDGLRP